MSNEHSSEQTIHLAEIHHHEAIETLEIAVDEDAMASIKKKCFIRSIFFGSFASLIVFICSADASGFWFLGCLLQTFVTLALVYAFTLLIQYKLYKVPIKVSYTNEISGPLERYDIHNSSIPQVSDYIDQDTVSNPAYSYLSYNLFHDRH